MAWGGRQTSALLENPQRFEYIAKISITPFCKCSYPSPLACLWKHWRKTTSKPGWGQCWQTELWFQSKSEYLVLSSLPERWWGQVGRSGLVLAGVLLGIQRTIPDGNYTITFYSDMVVAVDTRGCWTNDHWKSCILPFFTVQSIDCGFYLKPENVPEGPRSSGYSLSFKIWISYKTWSDCLLEQLASCVLNLIQTGQEPRHTGVKGWRRSHRADPGKDTVERVLSLERAPPITSLGTKENMDNS